MSYRAEHYNVILKVVQERFQIANDDLPPDIWIAWRVSLKRMFDEGILIAEILAAIPEAGRRLRWPGRTAFWKRVRDVVLKNRRETRPPVRIERGAEQIGRILRRTATPS